MVQYQDAVNVLRPARPYQFILQLNYVVPNSGQPIKDKSLDVALHDNSKRSAVEQAITKAILGKIGS